MSNPTDAERLKLARWVRHHAHNIDQESLRERVELADALEAALAREQAAIKERDHAIVAEIEYRKFGAEQRDLACDLSATNAKLTEENRVLRALIKCDCAGEIISKAKEEFHYAGCSIMKMRRLTLAAKPAGANDDH